MTRVLKNVPKHSTFKEYVLLYVERDVTFLLCTSLRLSLPLWTSSRQGPKVNEDVVHRNEKDIHVSSYQTLTLLVIYNKKALVHHKYCERYFFELFMVIVKELHVFGILRKVFRVYLRNRYILQWWVKRVLRYLTRNRTCVKTPSLQLWLRST